MNWDQVSGQWTELKGKMRQRWGRLTNDEFDVIKGNRQELAGKIQQVYGKTREEAEKEIEEFCRIDAEAKV